MGYYTTYEIRVTPANREQEVIEKIEQIRGYVPFYDPCKWYEWEDDMSETAAFFGPDVVLSLYGYGEDSGDVWVAHFCGYNEMQFHKMPKWVPPEHTFNNS